MTSNSSPSTSAGGYYRFPCIWGDQIVFHSETDLWQVSTAGGPARRITSGPGTATHPAISPDGKWLAFTCNDEGYLEVYLQSMDPHGPGPERITFLGGYCMVVNWTPDGKILFASDAHAVRALELFTVDPKTQEIEPLNIGHALQIDYGPNGAAVIEKNGMASTEPAFWKRYQGGTAGVLWIDRKGDGEYERLLDLESYLKDPWWIGDRIYFLSDHEGFGNIYSCDIQGQDIQAHTQHQDFYVRNISTDKKSIVYHSGADIYQLDLASHQSKKIEIAPSRHNLYINRKFESAGDLIGDFNVHPKGHLTASVHRGQLMAYGNWDGPTYNLGETGGATQYRMPVWLHEKDQLCAVSDQGLDFKLEVFEFPNTKATKELTSPELGRPVDILPAPNRNTLAITNHQNALFLVDLDNSKFEEIDRSKRGSFQGLSWSPDGKFLAYAKPHKNLKCDIHIYDLEKNSKHLVTDDLGSDTHPSFSPDGKTLWFASQRIYNPVYDNMHFDLGFQKGMGLYVIHLEKDQRSVLIKLPDPGEDSPPKDEKSVKKDDDPNKKDDDSAEKKPEVKIDFEGIHNRIQQMPVPEGIIEQVFAAEDRVFYSTTQPRGELEITWKDKGKNKTTRLMCFNLKTLEPEPWVDGIDHFEPSLSGKHLIYQHQDSLRIISSAEKPSDGDDEDAPSNRYSEQQGWINTSRLHLEIEPRQEFRHMLKTAWRLQRDHFWNEEMSQVDWNRVLQNYLPLADRANSRGEISDLIWEMQGELATSHAYEFGGDHPLNHDYVRGFLGARFKYDQSKKAFQIDHLYQGNSWIPGKSSPLAGPGAGLQKGDWLHQINGRPLTPAYTPDKAMLNRPGEIFELEVESSTAKSKRKIYVKSIASEAPLRYRDWVNNNRQKVHEETNGRIGYIHVPDMGAQGYAEFHRYFLAELGRDGLIVDVRYNGGGHVSALLLEKLQRKTYAYFKSRWMGDLPHPDDSFPGPMVCLTNEFAGSDGDIFSHGFKKLGLGPLIGKRTWGGVVGIDMNDDLIDGGMTTQPEYAFWTPQEGWTIENRGVDPDIEVEYRPQDYAQGHDPQMARAIKEIQDLLETSPPFRPDFHPVPDRRV